MYINAGIILDSIDIVSEYLLNSVEYSLRVHWILTKGKKVRYAKLGEECEVVGEVQIH